MDLKECDKGLFDHRLYDHDRLDLGNTFYFNALLCELDAPFLAA